MRRLNVVVFALLVVLGSISFAQLQTEVPRASVRFANVDVLVDPHGASLAAYQLEFLSDPTMVTLVGIEGGQHPAFKQPPYYDPKALSGGNRVILAALNAGTDLPREKTRVARLHLQIKGDAKPNMSAKMVVAASSNEKSIQADVTVSEGATP